jgi:hypothetical protein
MSMTDEIISTNPDEIADFWAKTVYPYTAPIVEANERLEPDPSGSAVRVTFAAKEYLVTAAHVIEGHLQGSGKDRSEGAPYSYIPEQVDIEGEVVTSADPIDLAIVRLPRASRAGLQLPQHLALEVQGRRTLSLRRVPGPPKVLGHRLLSSNSTSTAVGLHGDSAQAVCRTIQY